MRKIKVVQDGISAKVLASALTALAIEALLHFGIGWSKPLEVVVGFAAVALAGYLVPEKQEPGFPDVISG